MPVPNVVYECLVQDTPRELRPLFYWLGLDWPVPKASLPWAVPPELGLQVGPWRHVAPQIRRLVVFPSTMWHATESFGDGERMTIAFDLAPPFEETQK